MRPADVILLNAREVRRRSEIAWRGIPPDSLQWKPDSRDGTADPRNYSLNRGQAFAAFCTGPCGLQNR